MEAPQEDRELETGIRDLKEVIQDYANDHELPIGSVIGACAEMLVFSVLFLMDEAASEEDKEDARSTGLELLDTIGAMIRKGEADYDDEAGENQRAK